MKGLGCGLENVRSKDFEPGILRRMLGFELSEEGGTQHNPVVYLIE